MTINGGDSKGNGHGSMPADEPAPKKKRAKMFHRKSDKPWALAKREYVYGYVNDSGERVYPNLRQISERHNIQISRLGQVAKAGNTTVTGDWVKERDRAQVAIEEEAKKRAVASFGAELAQMENRHLRGHKAAESAIMVAMYQTDGNGQLIVPLKFRKELTPQDIKALYSVYCEATDRQRILMGQPTQRIEIQEQRTEPTVLRLLTAEDLANAGLQLAMAMTAKRKVRLMLPEGAEVEVDG